MTKYTLGSHDDCGEQKNGDAEYGLHKLDGKNRCLDLNYL